MTLLMANVRIADQVREHTHLTGKQANQATKPTNGFYSARMSMLIIIIIIIYSCPGINIEIVIFISRQARQKDIRAISLLVQCCLMSNVKQWTASSWCNLLAYLCWC